MEKGDHLISARTGYSHHGIYIGRDQVIHYSGSSFGEFQSGTIEIVDLETFCQGNGFTVQSYPFRFYNREESVERAKSRLGEDWYSVLLNNCEHFVTWCIQGLHHSQQVNQAVSGAVVGTALLGSAIHRPVLKTISNRVLPAIKQGESVRRLATSATCLLGGSSAGVAAAATGLATGVASGLTVATLSSVALPAVAGAAVAYGAINLLGSLFDN